MIGKICKASMTHLYQAYIREFIQAYKLEPEPKPLLQYFDDVYYEKHKGSADVLTVKFNQKGLPVKYMYKVFYSKDECKPNAKEFKKQFLLYLSEKTDYNI